MIRSEDSAVVRVMSDTPTQDGQRDMQRDTLFAHVACSLLCADIRGERAVLVSEPITNRTNRHFKPLG